MLTTERLLLRRLTPSDLDDLVALDADPDVMRFITGGRATARAHLEGTVLPALLAEYGRGPGLGRLAAISRASGEFLGWFGLRAGAGETPEGLELGYRLRRVAWGRGLATEGARALVRAAFEALGAERVWAQTMVVNVRSRRVLERAGLREVRVFFGDWPERIEGSALGDVEYAITRGEWEGR